MIVVVTGAARGIGFAITKKFAQNGDTVIACSRTEQTLKNSISRIKAEIPNVDIHSIALDISIEENADKLSDFVATIGAADILINNAGYFIPGSCFDDNERSLEKMMAGNLYSAFYVTRALLPEMLKKKCGHIFNMCSIASLKVYEGGGNYSVSKFALHGLTLNLRNELKDKGIKVTGVYPGAVLTDSWEGFDNQDNRIMVPDDIAELIFSAARLSPGATVEEIIVRPQKGDL